MSILGRCKSEFWRDTRGNVAMMFGLMSLPLIIVGGMAVDMQRANLARTQVQEAADAALLAVANLKKNRPNMTDADLTAEARKYFNFAKRQARNITLDSFNVKFDVANGAFVLELTGGIPTTLMRVAGMNSMSVNTLSQVKLGKPAYIEVMMALDNTGSMNGQGKLADLKKSAELLVETLFAQGNTSAKVGLVPFAQYANIGSSYGAASWLSNPGGKKWKGCVGSREYPKNLEDGDYAFFPVPGINGAKCPDPIQPLTGDKARILTAIGQMKGSGWTYIPAGLVWGWRGLTAELPFDEGATVEELKQRDGVKALVLMTDGANTRAPTYPLHDAANQSLANDLMARLCDSVKNDKIVLYTIAFKVKDGVIRGLMEDCATTAGHYFAADNSAGLASAFESIGVSLRSLSLSK